MLASRPALVINTFPSLVSFKPNVAFTLDGRALLETEWSETVYTQDFEDQNDIMKEQVAYGNSSNSS